MFTHRFVKGYTSDAGCNSNIRNFVLNKNSLFMNMSLYKKNTPRWVFAKRVDFHIFSSIGFVPGFIKINVFGG